MNTLDAQHHALDAHAMAPRRRRLGAAGLAAAIALLALGMNGCGGSDAQSGALLGAGIGAIGGAVIGHNQDRHAAEGAAIGAGVGALGGYIIGNESDKAKQRHYYHY